MSKEPVKKTRKNSNLPGAGPGRPKGQPNKTTALLKEAIILAAEAEGQDGKGEGGLTGYCRMLAKEEKKAFAQLMGKVLPIQVTGEGDGPLTVQIIRFADENNTSK